MLIPVPGKDGESQQLYLKRVCGRNAENVGADSPLKATSVSVKPKAGRHPSPEVPARLSHEKSLKV